MTTDNTTPYPPEILDEDYDDGTMPENVAELAKLVVGRRIVKAEQEKHDVKSYGHTGERLTLTLDDGRKVRLVDTYDCCAVTALESFFLNPDLVDHVITGVGTTGEFTTWHIYADLGDVMKLEVEWSSGNPFYYGYGFDISVVEANE